MADRREDTPVAPRRTLGQPAPAAAPPGPSGPGSSSAGEDTTLMTGPAGRPPATAARPAASGSQSAPVASTESGSPAASKARGRRTRKARLRLVHLDPWSVMKTSFLLSIAFGIVTVVAVAVVWGVLGAAGVWESINSTVTDVLGGETSNTFDVENYVGASRVLGFTMIVAVVDVILITAIATLGAFLYNLSAALLGGLEVTLAEDDR